MFQTLTFSESVGVSQKVRKRKRIGEKTYPFLLIEKCFICSCLIVLILFNSKDI